MTEQLVPAELFESDSHCWRDPATVVGFYTGQGAMQARLRHRASRGWWELLERLDVTLLVTREYEHLLLALCVTIRGPDISFLRLPHPSGMAVDDKNGAVHVALTRNPNQLMTLEPFDAADGDRARRLLWPRQSIAFAGATYFHDLVMIGGELHATAVGRNTIVSVDSGAQLRDVWWPACIDGSTGPDTSRNRLQLNSIAAGNTITDSFFTASVANPGRYDPGHLKFDPDRKGVIFDGRTREVLTGGLTRPHSARIHDELIWVANSGYGELLAVDTGGRTEVVAQLSGWTRGLAIAGDVAFVGTSRVLPRFRHYAPGVGEGATCGIHAVSTVSGRTLGSLTWPVGNQIFAIEVVPSSLAATLPYNARLSDRANLKFATDVFSRGPGNE